MIKLTINFKGKINAVFKKNFVNEKGLNVFQTLFITNEIVKPFCANSLAMRPILKKGRLINCFIRETITIMNTAIVVFKPKTKKITI